MNTYTHSRTNHYKTLLLGIIPTIALSFSPSASATSIRDSNGDLIRPGDSVNQLYQLWGQPTMRVNSERTCNRVEVKKVCSTSRLIWKRGDQFWLIQTQGRAIIKTGWTRRESAIRDKI